MLRNLLLIACLAGAFHTSAQKSFTVSVPSERPVKKAVPGANAVQEIGAPLPPFIVMGMPKHMTVTAMKGSYQHSDTTRANDIVLPGQPITNKDVDYDANLLLMFFNPTCGHCEDMTEQLEHNIFLFKKTKVLMVAAPNARPYIDAFQKGYHTDQYSSLVISTDSTDLIGKLFLYKALPQINVYDKDRKLIKTFSGDTPIDSLKPYIQ